MDQQRKSAKIQQPNNHVTPASRAPFTAINKGRDHFDFVGSRVRKAIANQDQQRLLDARKARLAAGSTP